MGIVDFDGRGNFTRNDAGNNGGVPKSNGAFNNNQFGTYAANPAVNPAVNPDCTGTMVINYGTRAAPAGVTLTVQIAISGDGTVVMGEMSSGTVPIGAEPPVVDDGKCGNPSPEAVQIGFEGKKVLVYGFR